MRTGISSVVLAAALAMAGLLAAAEPAATTQPGATTQPAAAPADELSLQPAKDTRLFFHPSETEFNGGTSPRLRASNMEKTAGEAIIMDFDRKAIAAFLEKNKDKAISGKLVLVSRDLGHGTRAKVEAATLDSASDWTEGDKNQVKAAQGEPTFSAAQLGVKAWTTADGKEVANFRDVFYDSKANKITAQAQAKPLTVVAADKDKAVSLELDAKFIERLGKGENCKGLIVFSRDRDMLVDFFSREQDGKSPKLVLTATNK